MKFISTLVALLIISSAYSQHDKHEHSRDTIPKKETHKQMEMETGHTGMSHSFSQNLPMNRNGSGTGWLPDNSPMYGYMYHSKNWMYMLHGNLFIRYNNQDVFNKGSRGDKKIDAPNWLMFMGQKNVGKSGLFRFSTMFSADALIAGGSGYPLLFQSGETYNGEPLIDRQHPHDLFSELSVGYTHAFSKKADAFIYLAYPGEPALGPVAFMHRPSALNNPDAPLTHHWVDATHITFGVSTIGFRYDFLKLEGSLFTGREPGENRYNFDKPGFDSWSTRLSFNPAKNWAIQLSHGFIKEPEAHHPGENVNRTTASVLFSAGSQPSTLNISAVWGMNKVKDHAGEHGFLLEGSHGGRKNSIYGRYEWVQKSVEELALDETLYGHDILFPVHALTAGWSYDIWKMGKTNFSTGAQFTIFKTADQLEELYGNYPIAIQVYIRIYPELMGMK